MEKFIIGLIEKELFNDRMHIQDKDISDVFHDQITFVLSTIGKEVSKQVCDYRLGVYLDTNNHNYKCYELNQENYWNIREKFGHSFFKHIEEYAKREREKGSELLFQLNNGELTLSDFDKKLKEL